MKALAVTELSKRAALCDMPTPTLSDDNHVLVKVHYSGVSAGTEMWAANGHRPDWGPVPFVNGYQVTGEVVEVGQSVDTAAVGDLVACFVRGAHGQYARGNGAYCHRLPDASLAKVASLFVQPSVGALCLNRAGVKSGDWVLIVGQGLIGQTTAQLARLRGAFVIAADRQPERMEISRHHCADVVLDAKEGPVSAQIKERFGREMDIVCESTGFVELIDDAIACCRSEGTFVLGGWSPGDVTFNYSSAHTRQITTHFPAFIGSYESRQSVLRMMARNELQIEPLITHLTPWTDGESVYNRLFTAERHAHNGIVFDWREA